MGTEYLEELYAKASAVQTQYREKLVNLSPEEILSHAYEYSVREDILLILEDIELPEDQCLALLASPDPIRDIYQSFSQVESDHMEILRNCVEYQAKDALQDMSSFSIRPMKPEERSLSYTAEKSVLSETGCIGHLRGDMDTDGKGFYTSWDDHVSELKTPSFKYEFDQFINALRNNKEYGAPFADRKALANYCYQNSEAAFDGNWTTEYGFRADTKHHSYMIRCNPNRGDYNFYVYAYDRQALDRYLQAAERLSTPIYLESAAHARVNGELALYRKSNQFNLECKEAIEAAIAGHYKDNRLDPEGIKSVVGRFGVDRVQFLLATTIKSHTWDGRYSQSNKDWADTIPTRTDPDGQLFLTVNSHPGLVNLCTTQFRRDVLKEPSVIDKLKSPRPPAKAAPIRPEHDQER